MITAIVRGPMFVLLGFCLTPADRWQFFAGLIAVFVIALSFEVEISVWRDK